MTLGEKLRQARLEAGLSQRQLCGEMITRNMLSQIEHDTARPSVDTLRYLAGRLGKSLGYFLDEESVSLPNFAAIRKARRNWEAKDWEELVRVLEEYRGPDGVFDQEKDVLLALGYLGLAEKALAEDRKLYALELLAKVEPKGYLAVELERRKLLMLARAGDRGMAIGNLLPNIDEELLVRSVEALEHGDAERAAALLDAAENRESPRWLLLRGRVHMALGAYAEAALCLEKTDGPERLGLLEICYREMGDFQRAYEYACRQREKK